MTDFHRLGSTQAAWHGAISKVWGKERRGNLPSSQVVQRAPDQREQRIDHRGVCRPAVLLELSR